MIHDAAFTDPARERKIFAGRLFITAIVVVVMAIVIIARYFDLQINRHQNFATHSDNNRVHVRPATPSRGLIYDRNGELLADNRPTYNLTIVYLSQLGNGTSAANQPTAHHIDER